MKKNLLRLAVVSGMLITMSATVNAQWTRNAGTLQTYLTNTGDNVGIGTTNPSYKLDIRNSGNSTMQFKSTTGNANIMLDKGTAGNTASLNYRTGGTTNWQTGLVTNTNYSIKNFNTGTVAMSFDYTNNNVGIGTTNPSKKLDIAGTMNCADTMYLGGSGAFAPTAFLKADGANLRVQGYSNVIMGSTASNSSILTVNYNGLVGINTTGLPGATLHVNGNIKINDGTQGEGKFLTSDANGLAQWGTLSLPSNDSSTTVQVTSSSTNAFVVPAGVTSLNIEAVGASGGGGGSGSANCFFCSSGSGGGGGGGEYGAMLLPVTPGDTIGVTVGNAGAGGSGDYHGYDGTAGGQTIVTLNGVVKLTMQGGSGGYGGPHGGSDNWNQGGAPGGPGGSGSIAPIVIPGGTSYNYNGGQSAVVKNGASVTGGMGGASAFTSGGNNSAPGLNGNPGMTGRVAITYFNPAAPNGNSTIHDGAVVFSQQGELTGNTSLHWDNTNNRLGVGTNTPDAKLVVVGTLKIADGTQGAGKVLTSDANGFASWTTPAPFARQGSTWTEEQQKEIESKDAKIAELESKLNEMQQCVESLCNNSSSSHNELSRTAELQAASMLFQNQPNPFNQTTVIRYQLSGDTNNGRIIIRDLNGNLVKQVSIAQSGKGQVTINANELAQGTYTYTLEIGGESVDTKLMVVTK